MSPTWLTQLINLLPHGLKIKTQMPPIYFYQDTKETAGNYSDTKIIPSEKKPLTYLKLPPRKYLICDLQKHVTRYKVPAIDFIMSLSRFHNNVLIVDNQLLAKLGANYHVVVLNAIADFAINRFPYVKKDSDLNEIINASTEKFNYQKNQLGTDLIQTLTQLFDSPLQCLLFLNTQNECFLALPCIYDKLANSSKHLPVLETDLKTITAILNQMPLVKINQIYPLRLYFDKISQKLHKIWSMTYYPDCEYYNVYNTIDLTKFNDEQRADTNNKALEELAYYEHYKYAKGTFSDLVYSLLHKITPKNTLDLVLDYHNSYFSQQLTELYQVLLDQTDHFFQKKLVIKTQAQGKIQINLKTPYQNMQRALDHAITNYQSHVWQYHFNDVVTAKNLKQVALAFKITHSQDIMIDNPAHFKPLVNSKGLNKINLGMQPSTAHQYYAVNHKLITFDGTKQISKISEIKL